MHIGPLNTVQYTVIYKLTNNKSKKPAAGFRMSQIMVFHISQKKCKAINMGLTLYVDYSLQMHTV